MKLEQVIAYKWVCNNCGSTNIVDEISVYEDSENTKWYAECGLCDFEEEFDEIEE